MKRLMLVSALVPVLFTLGRPASAEPSQGVGVTVTAPSATTGPGAGASPSASSAPGASASGSVPPASAAPAGNGTVVEGSSVTNPSPGGGGPLPHTGAEILRLVAVALGLITVGQVLVRAGRGARCPDVTEPLSTGPTGR